MFGVFHNTAIIISGLEYTAGFNFAAGFIPIATGDLCDLVFPGRCSLACAVLARCL